MNNGEWHYSIDKTFKLDGMCYEILYHLLPVHTVNLITFRTYKLKFDCSSNFIYLLNNNKKNEKYQFSKDFSNDSPQMKYEI